MLFKGQIHFNNINSGYSFPWYFCRLELELTSAGSSGTFDCRDKFCYLLHWHKSKVIPLTLIAESSPLSCTDFQHYVCWTSQQFQSCNINCKVGRTEAFRNHSKHWARFCPLTLAPLCFPRGEKEMRIILAQRCQSCLRCQLPMVSREYVEWRKGHVGTVSSTGLLCPFSVGIKPFRVHS